VSTGNTERAATDAANDDLNRFIVLFTTHRPAFLVTFLGFAVRVGWLLNARTTPVSDFNDYRTLAIGIIDHQQFGYPEHTSFFLPLHPTYVALFATISRSDLWLGLAAVLASTAAIPLAYIAALKIVGSKRGAILAAALFTFFPTLVMFSPVLATEHLFLALMLGAIVAATRLGSRPVRNSVVTGLLLGAAILTRGEAVFYVPAFLLFLLVATSSVGRRDRFRNIAVVLAMIAVLVVPWYIRNAVVVDPDLGLSSSAGLNFYLAHNDSGNYGVFIEGSAIYGLPPAEASALGWQLGFEHIAAHPLNLVKDAWTGTQRLFAAPDYASFWSTQGTQYRGDPDFFQRPVTLARTLTKVAAILTAALFSIAALSLLVFSRWPRELTFLLVPLILSSWVLRTVIYWAQPRYAYFITAMMIFLAALVLDTLITRSPTPASGRHKAP
jgi:4-amino-4-deoxy-L-arabinose transferase-like glycosyltransferase